MTTLDGSELLLEDTVVLADYEDRALIPIYLFEIDDPEEASGSWADTITQIEKWIRDPSQLNDEGAVAPTPPLLAAALSIAHYMKAQAKDPPLWVLPTDEGGICFERREGSTTEVIELLAEGMIEIRRFEAGRLVLRVPPRVGDELGL